jgi:hypothetical protein
MRRLKRSIPPVLAGLLLAGIFSIPGNTVYGVTVDDCKSIEIDSCDFGFLDALCDKLFSNPQPCEQICKSVTQGEQVGACTVCCNNIKGQLNLEQVPRLDFP